MSWFKKIFPSKVASNANGQKKGVPEGVWSKCDHCHAIIYRPELERNLYVCTKCDHHMRLGARDRLEHFLDPGRRDEIGSKVVAVDYLKFRDSKKYKDRISTAEKNTKETEALVVMRGSVLGMGLVAASFDFGYIGGSMGSAVGERFVLGVERSLEDHVPFVCFTLSGGARMQEGLISLMQMAKTSAALTKLSEKQIPYIAVLCHPTMGGVSASFAMLGDVILAEPGALVGFAGPRVIEQTVRETLPEGFQRSEFLLEHGHIDQIVDRREHRHHIVKLLAMLSKQAPPPGKAVEKGVTKSHAEPTETESDPDTGQSEKDTQ